MFSVRNLIFKSSSPLKQCKTIKFRLNLSTKTESKAQNDNKKLVYLLKKYESSIIYSGFLERYNIKIGYQRNFELIKNQKRRQENAYVKDQQVQPLPLSLKFLTDDDTSLTDKNKDNSKNAEQVDTNKDELVLQFPYETNPKIELTDSKFVSNKHVDDPAVRAQQEVESRRHNWMSDYENYEKDEIATNSEIDYGTPDPKSKISAVPCGGCGAFLHCKDTSLPGYIPSEIYKNSNRFNSVSLKSIICQRCYFLREHNLALQVRVSANDYPKILRTIQSHEQALVILMVDLLDFPCSIWPGAADLLGYGHPIFVVGNKIDLLPQDGRGFLNRIEENLRTNLKLNGFATTDIKHVSLISATTGFGIEDLITRLQRFWEYRGDIFLVGCTNVGKSSLFNALLQSDYCKTHAVDLIQRATISQWPGTTLNLLKFPINRPSGYKLYMRHNRLKNTNIALTNERQLRLTQLKKTKKPAYASLIGRIEQTFIVREPVEGADLFSGGTKDGYCGVKVGIDEKDEIYAESRWCYDTPGVIQSEQVLHLLTAEELMLTLPKRLIQPKTFTIKSGTSIFIGGLSRLDFVDGIESTKFTVYCSHKLPITICNTEDAEAIYNDFLQTEFFSVPENNRERLQKWPGLTESKMFTVNGIHKETSCADIVLSSSGWISITSKTRQAVTVKGWVPTNCGVHLRDPLLPYAVQLRGRRIRFTPAYRNNKFYVPK